jgi:hypothetical protein
VSRDVNGMDISQPTVQPRGVDINSDSFFGYPGTVLDIGLDIGYSNRISDSDII